VRTVDFEVSLRKYLESEIRVPEAHAEHVELHWRGEGFEDNQLLMIVPRMRSFERTGPRDGDSEIVNLEVTVAVKQAPDQLTFGLLSILVDEVRRLIDSTRRDEEVERPAVAKVFNREGVAEFVMDFGPAQESRSEGVSIQIGGRQVSAVDLAVLTCRVQVTPLRPTVRLRS